MDTEQEDYENIEDEGVVESTPRQLKKGVKRGTIDKKKPIETNVPVEKTPEVKYVAYKVQAQEGVMDTEIDTPVGTNIYVILAEILNKLNNIEISQG